MENRVLRKKFKLLGKTFDTINYGRCFIIDYKGALDVTVMFYSPPYVTKCTMGNLLTGRVANPYYARVYGVGYIGVGKYSTKDKEMYKLWMRLLERTNCAIFTSKNPAYLNVSICDEWLNFQNFAAWCEEQPFFKAKDSKGKSYQIDKDLLVKGNNTYSPETCCFVPQRINALLTKNDVRRGKFPIGVTFVECVGKYSAQVSRIDLDRRLGYYETPEEAFQAYKKAKESYIKEIANLWRGHIDSKAYEALMKWEVSIDD